MIVCEAERRPPRPERRIRLAAGRIKILLVDQPRAGRGREGLVNLRMAARLGARDQPEVEPVQ